MMEFLRECSGGQNPFQDNNKSKCCCSNWKAVKLAFNTFNSLSLQALNARSRALLMQKLDRTGMAAVVPPPAPLAGVPLAQIPHAQKPIGLPSQYLLLENMFDPLKEVSRPSQREALPKSWSGKIVAHS
jgi:hypothetical protein